MRPGGRSCNESKIMPLLSSLGDRERPCPPQKTKQNKAKKTPKTYLVVTVSHFLPHFSPPLSSTPSLRRRELPQITRSNHCPQAKQEFQISFDKNKHKMHKPYRKKRDFHLHEYDLKKHVLNQGIKPQINILQPPSTSN